MAINNFKPFATAANANVTAQADWETLPALLSGFMAGKASSAQVNKAIRQASFIAAALAQYTANKSGLDVLDDGDLNGFISKMGTAFGKDFQALDATLSALAGLATGANKLPYFTGNDTAAQTDLTSVGRDIIGKNTIADILTYLGLSSFADKAAETKQTFSYTVQAKYGYEVLSAAGEIVAALYADNRSAYLHSVSGKPVTIPDKAGTMALVDDLKAGLPPIGIPFFWPQAAMPNTVVDEWSQMVFLKMNDTTFSATQYPILAKVWPGLKLTDSRGEFIRINDDGRGIDAGRALLSAQGDAIRNITGGLGFVPMVGNVDAYGAFTVGGSQNIVNLGVDGNPTTIAQYMYFEAAKSGVPVAAENRPRNITFNLVVRAK